MKNRLFLIVIFIMCFSLFFSCQQDMGLVTDAELESKALIEEEAPVKKIIEDVGVIRYLDLEGGFWGIVGKQGNYDPINLPRLFQQNGLVVKLTAEVLDMASIHQWGRIVRLITMKTIKSEKTLVMDKGEIHHYFIQGGPWVIKGLTGEYQVINLPEKFQVENLKVAFTGVIRDDIITIPALWPIIELNSIKKIEGPVIVNLGKKFRLPVGDTAVVPGDKITFTFEEVLQESRCPIGVECFWQGEAVIAVSIKIGFIDYGKFKISTYNPTRINVGRYCFEFLDLVPYPSIYARIDPGAYIGTFVINSILRETEK